MDLYGSKDFAIKTKVKLGVQLLPKLATSKKGQKNGIKAKIWKIDHINTSKKKKMPVIVFHFFAETGFG